VTRELSANKILGKLDQADADALRPDLELVSLDQGETLITPGELIRHIYFPVSLLGSLVTVLEDGATVESGTVGREGMTGIPVILNSATTPMKTLVQVAGEAFRIDAARVKEVFDRGGSLYVMLNQYIHTLFVVASQSAACNRRHQVEQRLARWLLMSSDGIGSDDVAITQEFLAAMLGVRRPGVTEAAMSLQEEGLIQYKRGGVRIMNRRRLEEASCECYRMVKDEYERLMA
jgi:CRP-like cAMP-binding protein